MRSEGNDQSQVEEVVNPVLLFFFPEIGPEIKRRESMIRGACTHHLLVIVTVHHPVSTLAAERLQQSLPPFFSLRHWPALLWMIKSI